MFSAPKQEEINHLTIKLVVGLIALSLAPLTSFFAKSSINSISASYYAGAWSQSIFIGFLFAIAAFLLAYNGFSKPDMVLSKVASVAALGVAMFPCECANPSELVSQVHGISAVTVHGISATAMFLILVYFCYSFYRRALSKGDYKQAKRRARLYVVCGILIIVSILTLAFDHFSKGILSSKVPKLIFYGELIGLVAFGVSWLTASRVLPGLTRQDERFSPFK
jgi:predicted transporter